MSRDTNPSSPALAGEAARGEGSSPFESSAPFALKNSQREGPKPAKPEFDIAEAARLYAAGESLATIALQFGVCASFVWRRLRRAGVPTRPRGTQDADRLVTFDVAEAARLYAAGDGLNALARRFDASATTVATRLRQAGVQIRAKSTGRREPAPTPYLAEAIRRYAEGESLMALTRDYRVSRAALSDRLRKAGVEMRARGRRPSPVPRPAPFNIDEAIRLYNMGGSTHTIGRRLGVSWMTVRDHLIKAGVTLRPKGQPRPEIAGTEAAKAAHTDEVGARRQGRAAADRAEPITACPTGPLWFSAAWRNGWVERREELRAKRQLEWEREQNRLPPGGRRASQIGQRMSRATARARLGEAYA